MQTLQIFMGMHVSSYTYILDMIVSYTLGKFVLLYVHNEAFDYLLNILKYILDN